MDVIQIEKTGENFRLIYDVKARYTIDRIANQEAKYKLCCVREIKTVPKNVPLLAKIAKLQSCKIAKL